MKTAEITTEYLDHMGSDLTVVNAARASFGKDSTWLHSIDKTLRAGDKGLIRFLALGFRTEDWDALAEKFLMAESKEDIQSMLMNYKKSAQHWAPFGHPHLQMRMKLPLFLARQFVKHQIGATWSEESRRYMSSEPEFWFPKVWHSRPDDIKQGSGGTITAQDEAFKIARKITESGLDAYFDLMKLGVAPEEARTVLPLNTMTTVVWTGSLLFWSRVANQRLDGHAQLAAQELAAGLASHVQPNFPESWKALVG